MDLYKSFQAHICMKMQEECLGLLHGKLVWLGGGYHQHGWRGLGTVEVTGCITTTSFLLKNFLSIILEAQSLALRRQPGGNPSARGTLFGTVQCCKYRHNHSGCKNSRSMR